MMTTLNLIRRSIIAIVLCAFSATNAYITYIEVKYPLQVCITRFVSVFVV